MQTEPVVTRYEANATQLLAELEKIRAGQAQVSDVVGKQVAALSKQNEALQKSVKFWGGLNVAITALPGIVSGVSQAFTDMANTLQLRQSAAGVSINQLRDAMHGQVRETDLLTFAAQANHSVLKLSQTQMNQIAGAIRKLGLDGKDTTEATRAFGEALTQNETGPLKKFGLGLKDADGKAQSLAEVLRTEVVEASNAAAAATQTDAETMRASANAIGDAFETAKFKVAEFSVGAVKALGDAGRAIGRAAANNGSGFSMLMSFAGVKLDVSALRAEAIAAEIEAEGSRLFNASRGSTAAALAAGAMDVSLGDITVTPLRKGGGKGGGSGQKFDLVAYNRFLDALALKQAEVAAEAARLAPRGFDGVDGLGGFDAGGTLARERERNATLAQSVADDAAAQRDARESYLAGIFGPVEEYDAYAAGFGIVSDSIGAMYSAIVTGSEPAGKALKRMIAQGLLAEGVDMQIKALKYGALAVGWAFTPGGQATAAGYAQTAAMLQAGAIAAGVAASALGAGGSTGGGSGGARSAQPLGGNPAEAGGGRNNTTIVYGDSFANDSPRARQRTAAQLVDLARRETSSSARFN